MRIVGGRLKGRPIAGPPNNTIRPTSDRMRETLFNILAHGYALPNAETRVLDLFAGTGALGLEALSRGAASALFVDTSPEARGLIRGSIDTFGLSGKARLFRRDATRIGRVGTMQPFDLVFCDPPYGHGAGDQALAAAFNGGWLVDGAICVLEEEAKANIALPQAFDPIDQRVMGGSQIRIYRVQPTEQSS